MIKEDVCIKIKSISTAPLIESFKFRYWLNAKYVKNQVGKINKVSVKYNLVNNQYIYMNTVVNFNEETKADQRIVATSQGKTKVVKPDIDTQANTSMNQSFMADNDAML